MAKSTARATKADKKPAARSTRTTDVEVVEESSGMGFEGGVGIVAALLLITALLLLDHEMGAMGKGLFFKG